MNTPLNENSRWSHGKPPVSTLPMVLFIGVLVMAGGGSCGPVEALAEHSGPASRDAQSLEQHNGLSENGLSTNGLSTNGLGTNGLGTNGLSSTLFAEWFQQAPAQNNILMKYVVHCAAPAGEIRSYRDLSTGQHYEWLGELGLAPSWSSGNAATVTEQQVVSACLGAHANKYGMNVSISVLGRAAQGQVIPYTSQELSMYEVKEGCFFGNLFTTQGLFVGNDDGRLDGGKSSLRECALGATGCPSMVHVGKCSERCTRDPTNTYYVSCQFNGVSYRPITVRMREMDIYKCGDGICQVTERCGEGVGACKADCGACG